MIERVEQGAVGAEPAGKTLRLLTVGNSFSRNATRYLQDADDPAGWYANERSLKQQLQAEPWDDVTIQQVSIRSHNPDTYRPYAQQLFDTIRQYAPQAEVLMHQTWAYRCDDPRFAVESPENALAARTVSRIAPC